MNSPPPSSFDALSNESIVVSEGKRRSLSNLSPVVITTNRRRAPEPSLYPSITDLPTIRNADEVWASASRRFEEGNKRSLTTDEATAQPEHDEEHGSNVGRSKDEDDYDDHNYDDDDDGGGDSEESVDRKMVEVTPGHFVPLRGTKETLEAVEMGQMTNTNCVSCDVALVVHAAASLVICPDCEMIAPLERGDTDDEITSLGLGLKLEDCHLQEDIVDEIPIMGDLQRDPDEESLSS